MDQIVETLFAQRTLIWVSQCYKSALLQFVSTEAFLWLAAMRVSTQAFKLSRN